MPVEPETEEPEITLDFAQDLTDTGLHKRLTKQFCTVCFLMKPAEGFEPEGETCLDCRS